MEKYHVRTRTTRKKNGLCAGCPENNPFRAQGPEQCRQERSKNLSCRYMRLLTFQHEQFAQHVVGRGNDLGVGLKSPLDGDHADKFCSQIHVGLFQGIGGNVP